jgi:hypothetical protein
MIAAATAAVLGLSAASIAAPAFADDNYPACTHERQDHCREVGHQSADFPHHHHHHHNH